MTLTRKDSAATLVTLLAVAVFFTYHQGWNVPLIGDSIRWATGTVGLLGMMGCGLGEPGKGGVSTMVSATLGVAALVFLVTALVFASLTLFSLLVVTMVALWFVSTIRHTVGMQHRPLAH